MDYQFGHQSVLDCGDYPRGDWDLQETITDGREMIGDGGCKLSGFARNRSVESKRVIQNNEPKRSDLLIFEMTPETKFVVVSWGA